MKINRSGSRPNLFNAGGKSVLEELIHIVVPELRVSGANSPETKPLVAAESSSRDDINSCTAPKGNEPFGKASFISSNPIFKAGLLFEVKPAKRRISPCNFSMISAFIGTIRLIQ